VWDAESGQALETLTGIRAMSGPQRSRRDGKRVVTASGDQTARDYIVDLVDLVTWAEHQLPIDTK
jgi:hypothetical protein